MKILFPLAAAIAALAFATGASAQLKPKAGSGLALPPTAATPTVPAAPQPSTQISGNAQKEADGKLAAAGWLVLLDRRDWGTAWETSATMFRTTVPLAAWMDGIPQLRGPMGRFVERVPGESVYKTTLEGRPDGEYVSVVFESKFENKQVLEVVTTVRDSDGKWRVTGYSVR